MTSSHAQMDFVKIGIMAGKGATKGAKVQNTIYLYLWLASNLRTIAKCWYIATQLQSSIIIQAPLHYACMYIRMHIMYIATW